MVNQMERWRRTHYCGEVAEADLKKTVTILGWVQKSRNLGSLIFADIRDRTGLVQVVFNDETEKSIFEIASELHSEYVVGVCGVVRRRDEAAVNAKMKTGALEILAEDVQILNRSETPPIYIEEDLNVNEATRHKYRYLDLRRPDVQRNLMVRHRIAKITRDFFDANGFLEIETPMLTKSTPEGARDYLVPSRIYPGSFFALPQSPQLFKQLLMVSGFDRYMQIVKCFRDEDLRADRQPEFTQIDLEMSFVTRDDIMEINEAFLSKLFRETLKVEIEAPIPRLTYAEAMRRFGSDKPDTRFAMELADLTAQLTNCGFKVFDDAIAAGGAVRAINAKGCGQFTRKQIDALTEFVKKYRAKGLAWAALEQDGNVRCSFSKFLTPEVFEGLLKALDAQTGDLVLLVSDPSVDIVAESLGQLRVEIAKMTGLIRKDEYKLLWVTEFPMFEYDEENSRWQAKHHPFTAPMEEDLELLKTDPGKVRAQAYDIVINGMEAGGGSIRINSQELQSQVFGLLGFTPEDAKERFDFLLEAFRYGAPPHGGIAYGLDRLTMIITGCESIKDVIAFPKAQTSSCLLTGAPSPVDREQLDVLGLSAEPEESKAEQQ